MSIILNGNEIGSQITLNNTDLSEIIFNGVSVWQSVLNLKKLPYSFYFGSAVVYQNEIHILGGYDSANYKKHYKFNGTNWVSVGTLPVQVNNDYAVVCNDDLYIIGYPSGSSTRYLYKYNGSSWSNMGSLPFILYEGVVVVLNNYIHIIQKNGIADGHYRYNGSSWESLAIPTNKTSGSKAVVWNNSIYLMGGTDLPYQTYIYDPLTNIWTKFGKNNPHYGFARGSVVIYNNQIHQLGGFLSSNDIKTDHYALNENWIKQSTLPYQFYDGCAVVYKNKIIILGAYTSGVGADYSKNIAQWDGTEWTVATD